MGDANTLHCDYYNADDIKKTSGFADLEAAQHVEMLRNKALDEGKRVFHSSNIYYYRNA